LQKECVHQSLNSFAKRAFLIDFADMSTAISMPVPLKGIRAAFTPDRALERVQNF
jgi:hypothetical protein